MPQPLSSDNNNRNNQQNDIKRPLSQFTVRNGVFDYLRCAFLCSEVPPITEAGKSLLYCQREAWLRFATSSLQGLITLFHQSQKQSLTSSTEAIALRVKVRVAITIVRLLAVDPDDSKPDQCWDSKRSSLINSAEFGAYLLCLLLESKGSWNLIGQMFLERKWLIPSLFAFKIANPTEFIESDFLLTLAAKQTTSADTIFFTAAAALMNETASTVIQLATEAKKVGQWKWAIELLCGGWHTWKNSSKKTKGHVLLMECFETFITSSDVLIAGYELLCALTDGVNLNTYQRKLQVLQKQKTAQINQTAADKKILRNLRCQLSLGSSQLFAPLLLNAFQTEDIEDLKQVIAHQQQMYANVKDRPKLPAPVRANLLFPEAILDILQSDGQKFMGGICKLLDALVLTIGAGLDDYVKVVAEVLFEPRTRLKFLTIWRNELHEARSMKALLNSHWLQDIGRVYDNAQNTEFQFGRSLSNSAELRGQRLFERAIDSVAIRDGAFEAAMSCVDATTVCVGQASRVKMFLKAARYFYHAATLSSSVSYKYACVIVGSITIHCASRIVDKLSPVLRSYFTRQILYQQFAFLQMLYTLSPGKVPHGTEEFLITTEMTLHSMVSEYAGFPVICSIQLRAFDDLICELVFDQLSDTGITYLETHLAGLVTLEQWTYWRFEGVWQSWLHNPLNEAGEVADEKYLLAKRQRVLARQMEEREPTREELAREQKDEDEYKKKRLQEKNENAWLFLEQERGDVIVRYLEEKQWTWEDVSRIMNGMCVPRTPDGFIHPTQSLKLRKEALFSSFDGFEINRTTGTLRFLLTEAARSGKPALFGWQEIQEIFKAGAIAMVFSLDAIDPARPMHPFQWVHFKPEQARGTTALSCMLHTDYLLKFLTCGLEVSCCPPFKQRDVRDGFLRRLPKHIQEAISVIWANGGSRSGDQAHRFWIDAGTLPYAESRTDSSFRVVYGKQSMRVKKHKLRVNAEGKLVDDDGPEDTTDREYQFAQNFTRYYDEIATCFPEFAMLAEYSKMIAATGALLLEAVNCKANIKHIGNQLDTITNDIEASLRSQLGGIEFPMAGSRKVDTLIEEHVEETNKLNGYRLTYSEKNTVRTKARTEFQRQAREADTQQVNSLATALKVSGSAVRDMLTTKSFFAVAREQARTVISNGIDKLENTLTALRREGLPVDGNIESMMKNTMSGDWATSPAIGSNCAWVPSVFRPGFFRYDDGGSSTTTTTGSIYRVYGGVSLCAHLNEQVVNPPPTSQYVTSTETLSAQRAIGAPFSTAATIDNQHRANQEFFQRQQQVLQQIVNQRAINAQQQMMQSFASGTSTSHNTGQSVRRYGSSIQSAAQGAYWTPDQFHSRTDARNQLAILPEWNNSMKYLAIGNIPSNATVYAGRAAPQGTLPGGATQFVTPNVWDQRQMEATTRVYKHEWTPHFFETWKQVK